MLSETQKAEYAITVTDPKGSAFLTNAGQE